MIGEISAIRVLLSNISRVEEKHRNVDKARVSDQNAEGCCTESQGKEKILP